MASSDQKKNLYLLHGVPIRLHTRSRFLDDSIDDLLAPFLVHEFSSPSAPIDGTIERYDESSILRRLPSSAARISLPDELTEVFQLDETYWLIDDRWGLAEINLLKSQWRAWILPQPAIHPQLCLELAVLWPLAQLTRGKGMALVPAASVVRDGWGALLVAHSSIEPELVALLHAGFRIVGQHWTALRDDSSRLTMLHLPGKVERCSDLAWVDLTADFCGAAEAHASCDAVFLIDRARRPVAHIKSLPRTNALLGLRQSWPIAHLHGQRRLRQLQAKLARQCKCFAARLSRRPEEILRLMDDARYDRVPALEATVHVAAPARRVVA